jgi:hypothetical protein
MISSCLVKDGRVWVCYATVPECFLQVDECCDQLETAGVISGIGRYIGYWH